MAPPFWLKKRSNAPELTADVVAWACSASPDELLACRPRVTLIQRVTRLLLPLGLSAVCDRPN